ncbi:DUF1648 domain-containing protein [Lactococcus laudensis]|uniref:DUF1648 domain-containing protein n=1 Tax=Pseudolactococcus laudensis TaxID=1494461 RepID=UPI0039F25E5F
MLWPTLVGLLPIVMGLAVYSKLPEKMPIHWGLMVNRIVMRRNWWGFFLFLLS